MAGLTIRSGLFYTQNILQSYHISSAILELPLAINEQSIVNPLRVTLWIIYNEREYLLCQLSSTNVQCELNLNFSYGEQVTYYLIGMGVIHLTGYMLESIPDLVPIDENHNDDAGNVDNNDDAEREPEIDSTSNDNIVLQSEPIDNNDNGNKAQCFTIQFIFNNVH